MSFKLTVVGAGPGGYGAAVRAAQLGAQVTLIERQKAGGTCLNRGCIPSKVMRTTAEMLAGFNRAAEFGIRLEGSFSPDMQALLVRKEKIVNGQIDGLLKLFKQHKINYLRGAAHMKSPDLTLVQTSEAEKLEIPSQRLILAPGSRPLELPTLPFDHQKILSSNDALMLPRVPESLLIVGGGVIGCEFACLFATLGSQVTLVETMPRLLPLPSLDAGCSKVLQREMKKRKIQCLLNHRVRNAEERGEKIRVNLEKSSEPPNSDRDPANLRQVEVEKALVCIGRAPSFTATELAEIGLNLDPGGWIPTDQRMRTNLKGVYAVGDALGPSRMMLAHAASAEGRVAAENAAGGDLQMHYGAVPAAIFTIPEVAAVGMSEEQARGQEYSVRAEKVLFRNLGKAHVLGEIAGEAKIISDAQTGRILGIHIVGAHATDLIAEGALAVRTGISVPELAQTIHAHPTLSEIMAEVAHKALGRPVHG